METRGIFAVTEAVSQTRRNSHLGNVLLMSTFSLQRRKHSCNTAAIPFPLKISHSGLWELTIGQGRLGIHPACSLGWQQPSHSVWVCRSNPSSPDGYFWVQFLKQSPWLSFMLLAFGFIPKPFWTIIHFTHQWRLSCPTLWRAHCRLQTVILQWSFVEQHKAHPLV